MPKKTYVVDLKEEERTRLLDLINKGEHAARKLNRARILLLADEGKTDHEIAEALHTGTATVQRPSFPSIRRFAAGQRFQYGFSLLVQLFLRTRTWSLVECAIQVAFHKPLPGSLHGSGAGMQRFRNFAVGLAFVSKQQYPGTIELTGRVFAFLDQVQQVRSLFLFQTDDVGFLGHDFPPAKAHLRSV